MRHTAMRKTLLASLALSLSASAVHAQSVEDIVARYIQRVGGLDRIQSLQTISRTGTFYGGGGFEARVHNENKRPNKVREEFGIQGMTGVNAYDGKSGWKI